MSDKAKSIIAAGWIAAAAGAFIFGSSVRDRVDLATPSRGGKMGTMVASRDDSIGGRVQTDIPAGDFFYELTEKLKKEFYEPIGDEQKLASGAVRGMIGYLGDPESMYMDKDEFRVFLNERQGKFEGIGADLEVLMLSPTSGLEAHGGGRATVGGRQLLQPSPSEDAEDIRDQALANSGTGHPAVPFPRLAVVSVVPGGPADRAGVRPGDIVYSVDDHWVVNPDLETRFSQAESEFRAHKIAWAQLNDLRKEVRDKYEHMILPLRAKDRLVLGSAGQVKVVWERNGVQRTTQLQRTACSMPGFRVTGETITLPFTPGAADELRRAVAGKSAVTIDLRNNTLGDFGVMRECIAAVAPAGIYGYEANQRGAAPVALRVSQGNSNPPKLTLLTDQSTRGPAEIFALALSSRGYAKLSGNETGGARAIYDIVALPEGAGYTLVTSRYRPKLDVKPGAGAVAAKGGHRS